MKQLEGIHHISAITSDAQRNVDFYVGVLGLRLIKKSVNQDHTSVYHLFYGDEQAHPGADMTFFEYPGLPAGRAGEGMVHRIVWRVASPAAIDFWETRLHGRGYSAQRSETGSLTFADWEGLEHELLVTDVSDAPLVAEHPEIPAELAIQGFHSVRAYSARPEHSQRLLEETLGFVKTGDSEWEARGENRGGSIVYDTPPEERARQGSGTVHHVAWAMYDEGRGRLAPGGTGGRRPRQPGDRPLLLQLDLLPRALGRAVRAGHAQSGLHGRRAARAARGETLIDPAVRAPA